MAFSKRTKFQYILNQRPFKENIPSIDFNACQNLPSTSFTSIGRSFLFLRRTYSNKSISMLIHKVCYNHASPYSHKSATMLVLILINALPYYVVLILTGLPLCYSPHSHKSVTMLVLLLTSLLPCLTLFSELHNNDSPYSH